MRIEVIGHFCVPKAGLTLEECEDQYAIGTEATVAVVADGASESAYSRLWARCLVERFLEEPTMAVTEHWLLPAVRRFNSELDYARMPWYTVQKLGRGTYATLMGVVLDLDNESFSAIAVGDSCLAWYGEMGAGCFPFQNPEEMSMNPYLICHLWEHNRDLGLWQRTMHTPLGSGETWFFLMTDALAHWYLSEQAKGRAPWNELKNLHTHDLFEEWVVRLRGEDLLRNDDVTLVTLRVNTQEDGSSGYGPTVPIGL